MEEFDSPEKIARHNVACNFTYPYLPLLFMESQGTQGGYYLGDKFVTYDEYIRRYTAEFMLIEKERRNAVRIKKIEKLMQ